MNYVTFEINNNTVVFGDACIKQYKDYSEAMAVIEDDELDSLADIKYGSDCIDVGEEW